MAEKNLDSEIRARDADIELDAANGSAERFALRFGMVAMTGISVLALALAVWLILTGHPEGAYLLALPVLTALPKLIAAFKGNPPPAD